MVKPLSDDLGGHRMAAQIAVLARARSALELRQRDRLAIALCGWHWDKVEVAFVAGTAPTGRLQVLARQASEPL